MPAAFTVPGSLEPGIGTKAKAWPARDAIWSGLSCPSSSASPFLTLDELASHLRIGGGRGDGNRQLAVVGSSGNLLGSGLGSVIDEAVVIRVTVWQVEVKTAFLESKGVDAFTIAQAACVSLADYEAFGPVQTEKYA